MDEMSRLETFTWPLSDVLEALSLGFRQRLSFSNYK